MFKYNKPLRFTPLFNPIPQTHPPPSPWKPHPHNYHPPLLFTLFNSTVKKKTIPTKGRHPQSHTARKEHTLTEIVTEVKQKKINQRCGKYQRHPPRHATPHHTTPPSLPLDRNPMGAMRETEVKILIPV
jgi:hypothetical protein